jgi:hypothetical protein
MVVGQEYTGVFERIYAAGLPDFFIIDNIPVFIFLERLDF